MSVRDKYRSTLNELQRAESIPERISVFRRVWEWIIVSSRKIVALFGIVLIPVYLIGLAWWNFGNCGYIPTYLLLIGLGIFVCALYIPFYEYAKKKAIQDRQERIDNHLEPTHEGVMYPEEVYKFIPFHMKNISNYAFIFLMTVAPSAAYWTFSTFSSRNECDSLTYWTAFVIGTIYCLFIVTLLASCLLCCCYLIINRNYREEVENI